MHRNSTAFPLRIPQLGRFFGFRRSGSPHRSPRSLPLGHPVRRQEHSSPVLWNAQVIDRGVPHASPASQDARHLSGERSTEAVENSGECPEVALDKMWQAPKPFLESRLGAPQVARRFAPARKTRKRPPSRPRWPESMMLGFYCTRSGFITSSTIRSMASTLSRGIVRAVGSEPAESCNSASTTKTMI